MIRICAWCKKNMGITEYDVENNAVTHGICLECEKLVEFEPVKTQDILNEFNNPVLLMNDEGCCVVANTAASKTLKKEINSIEGCLGGDIISCVHAMEPGGCGEMEHCSGCTIRNTVIETFKTGKSHLKVEAYQYIQNEKGVKKTKFLVSTEKRGNKVLLRID